MLYYNHRKEVIRIKIKRKISTCKTGGNASKNSINYRISLPKPVIEVIGGDYVIMEVKKNEVILRRSETNAQS